MIPRRASCDIPTQRRSVRDIRTPFNSVLSTGVGGAADEIVNGKVLSLPPPGALLVTAMFLDPIAARPPTDKFTVILVVLSMVVEFNVTSSPKSAVVSPDMKLVPRNTTLSVCNL